MDDQTLKFNEADYEDLPEFGGTTHCAACGLPRAKNEAEASLYNVGPEEHSHLFPCKHVAPGFGKKGMLVIHCPRCGHRFIEKPLYLKETKSND